jgi:hypothetical protein
MKIKVVNTIVTLIFLVPGFGLLFWKGGPWVALGMALIVIGASVRFTK